MVDATSVPSDDESRVAALAAENASLRDELARAHGALANLRARYHQLLEELHLLKRRLVIAKAERLDDVAAAQLAFDKLLAETQAIEKVLDEASDTEGDNNEDDAAPADPNSKRRARTGSPPTGRRKLEECDLPEVVVEIPDPELEGKAERIGVEVTSRVAFERGGHRRLVMKRFVYKEAMQDESSQPSAQGESSTTDEGRTAAAPKGA